MKKMLIINLSKDLALLVKKMKGINIKNQNIFNNVNTYLTGNNYFNYYSKDNFISNIFLIV